MGIEYFIIAMDSNGATTKEEVLEIFSPYWTEEEKNYYFLDYGKEINKGHIVNIVNIVNIGCHFDISFYKDNPLVSSVTIYKPCGDIRMEQAIFQLISKFPMFVTYPSDPPMIITSNEKCAELFKIENPEFAETIKLVCSFEEYYEVQSN